MDAVERALAVLSAFDEEAPTLRLSDLAARTGFYKSTVLRLLQFLERKGGMLLQETHRLNFYPVCKRQRRCLSRRGCQPPPPAFLLRWAAK